MSPLSPTNWGPGSSGSGSGGSPGLPVPADNALLAWAYDPIHADSSSAMVLGTLILTRLDIPSNMTVASLVVYVANNLTGTPTFAGGGLYDGSGSQTGSGVGQRHSTTADQSANWAGTGTMTMALTADGGKSLSLVGGSGVWVYAAVLVAGGTTGPAFARFNQAARNNIGLTAAQGFRFGQLSGQTSLPSSITLASLADPAGNLAWAGLK